MFDQKELQTIALLIQSAPITGKDSVIVALLLQKINGLLSPVEKPVEAPPKK